jgi:hypothetical protein
MCALVVYDAWLTQQALRDGDSPALQAWDWQAVERLFPGTQDDGCDGDHFREGMTKR